MKVVKRFFWKADDVVKIHINLIIEWNSKFREKRRPLEEEKLFREAELLCTLPSEAQHLSENITQVKPTP